uniref:zinc ribbon domain-containing protein n=1 Tax=Streptomyces canus TaxID=58343 RepID=UPI0027D80C42|nr:zinc ribbon domain-containing protein [Streptomyces canus]
MAQTGAAHRFGCGLLPAGAGAGCCRQVRLSAAADGTSRTCAECGHIDRANRVSQAFLACRNCGFVDHADRWGHLPLERSREWGRLPQHPRPRVEGVATRGPVNGPRPTPDIPGRAGRRRSITASDARCASPGL